MKTIIIIVLLFAGVLYSQDGQPDRLIRRTEASTMIADSLVAVRASVALKLDKTVLPDSLNPIRSSITLKLDKTALTDSFTTRGYQTASQVSIAVSPKLDKAFGDYPKQITPVGTDIIPVIPDGLATPYFAELGALPASLAVQALLSDKASDTDLTNAIEQISTSMNAQIDSLNAVIVSLTSRVQILEGEIIIPDPLAPTLLIATTVDTSIVHVSFTASTSICDSTYLYYKKHSNAIWTASTVLDSGVVSANISGLTPTTEYDFTARTVKYSGGIAMVSNQSNIDTATTLTPSLVESITPDLAGWLIGTSIYDFSYRLANAPHTFTASGGYYNIIMGLSTIFNETDFAQKTFTAQNDSLFVGTKIIMPAINSIRPIVKGAAMDLFGVRDSVTNLAMVAFGIDDANSDSTYDEWTIKYKTGGSTITDISTTNFTTGTKKIDIVWNDVGVGTGYIKVFINDTLVFNKTSLSLSTYNPNAVYIGSSTGLGTNEYAHDVTFEYDSVYADSRQIFQSGGDNTVPIVQTYDYYVSATATGGGNGSEANPFTLFEATSIASPGDTVLVKMGTYNVTNTTGKLNFAKDGTAANPIVFIGEKIAGYDPKTVVGDSMTYINSTNYTYDSQAGVNVTGDYVKWQNLCVRQSYNGKMLLSITGKRFEMDSCVIQYPSNVSSSSVHTIRIAGNADSVFFKHSYFWHGSRTIIWVEGGSTNTSTPDYFMMDGCTMTGATNHYAIQLMPETTLNPSTTEPINGAVLRNNLFIDNNYVEGAVLFRHNKNFKFYNNVVLNSGGLLNMLTPVPASGDRDTCNTEGSIIAYNTVIDTTNTLWYMFRNSSGGNQLIVKNNLILFNRSRSDLYSMDWRCLTPAVGSIYRHQIDYNSWAFTAYSVDAEIIMWDCSATSRYLNSTWTSVLGYDTHGIFNEVTTFANIPNLDFEPVAGSAVINAGTSLSALGITTDRNGTARSVTTPTIGAVEYTP
jgi:hypothetical protein